MPRTPLPTKKDVLDAATQLSGIATRTPTLEFPVLNDRVGCRVLLKPEIFQVTGSFKFRGAWNRLSRLTDPQKTRGVVAFSSGNHAQGIAAAAKLLEITATIVMPQDAPAIKVERTRALGAEIVFYDRYSEDREAIAANLADQTGAILIPSYDDAHIIAGQGTAALELFEDAAQSGTRIDALLVPCGGGGLTAGCVLAREAISPGTDIFTVEPEGYDDHARSFVSGARETADISRKSTCDALLAPTPGEMTFAINRTRVKAGLVVSEKDVIEAMRYAFTELKLVVEPGGCVALAALLGGKMDLPGGTYGAILSGGNIENSSFWRLLSDGNEQPA